MDAAEYRGKVAAIAVRNDAIKHTRSITLACVLTSLLGWNLAAAADSPGTATTATAPVATADTKIYTCIEGLISLLPGDYYACRARYYFERNDTMQGVSMLESAAYWAKKDAQYVLGLIYFNGDTEGYVVNRPVGLAWLGLAAERKDPAYVRTFMAAQAQSTPADVQQADLLRQKLVLKYGDKIAGKRAMERFSHGIQSLEQTANAGGTLYLSGYSAYPENAMTVVSDMHKRADTDFQGLIGTVTVGDIEK